MKNRFIPYFIIGLCALGIFLLTVSHPVVAGVEPQSPTIAVPTVTPLTSGPMVMVNPGQNETYIKVRSGPHVLFSQVGILAVGQKALAKGKTAGGDWIMIDYPGVPGGVGWVYSGFVSISPGDLPIIEPVSTPTPLVSQTIDPTLAAQFMITSEPTRLATFTPAVPISIPTYATGGSGVGLAGVPMGLVIVLLAALGVIIGLISFLANR